MDAWLDRVQRAAVDGRGEEEREGERRGVSLAEARSLMLDPSAI